MKHLILILLLIAGINAHTQPSAAVGGPISVEAYMESAQGQTSLYTAPMPLKQPPTWWGKHKRGIGIAAYHLGTVALGAVGDGLYLNGEKEWAHALQAAEVLALASGPFVFHMKKKEWLPYISSYAFIRFAMFDGIFNATAGLPVDYIGSTSYYDKFRQELNAPPGGWYFAKGLSLVLGIGITIKYF